MKQPKPVEGVQRAWVELEWKASPPSRYSSVICICLNLPQVRDLWPEHPGTSQGLEHGGLVGKRGPKSLK